MATASNYYGLPMNKYGLIDKTNQAQGMSEVDVSSGAPLISQRVHLNFFDTRNCIGELSLYQARLAFAFNAATNGLFEPKEFKKILNPDGTVNLNTLISISSGLQGYPTVKDTDPYIRGNTITYPMQNKYKWVRSLEFINIIIPRDIIPMYVYFPNFIDGCIPYKEGTTNISYINTLQNSGGKSIWNSPVVPEINSFIDKNMQDLSAIKLAGVYETPLRFWRTYTGPNSMSNPHTPPPYQLWNPPQNTFSDDPWPFQFPPVMNQRIPSYRAKNGVVFSGYGLYDLEDFPPLQEMEIADGTVIQIPLRKMILKLIVPKDQYINGVSAEQLIDISEDDDFNDSGIVDNPLIQTGYGHYQRFIPGPGLGSNYQPNQWRNGKSAPIDLTVSTYDSESGIIGPMPVPFPNFRGNVWGPYNRPGDRFQNNSLQATIDELYLNGDLDNLTGNPILFPGYEPSQSVYTFSMFTLNLTRPNDIVRFQNFETSSNPNIKNSMRVTYDGGFGATYSYVGKNTVSKGVPGPIVTGGLPNTQYDGEVRRFNVDTWMIPKEKDPSNWLETLAGPQRPDNVSNGEFPGWMYIWRDIFPYTGKIYVPCTSGGTGPMSMYEDGRWKPENSSVSEINYTTGSSEWSSDPVLGQASSWGVPESQKEFPATEYLSNVSWGRPVKTSLSSGGTNYKKYNETTKIKYYATSSILIKQSTDLNVIDVTGHGQITNLILNQFDTSPAYYNIPATILGSGDKNATMMLINPPEFEILNTGSGYTTGLKSTTGPGTEMEVYITTSLGSILTLEIISGGEGYEINDEVSILGGTGGLIKITSYPTSTDWELTTGGSNYKVQDSVPTYNNIGTGNGLIINVLSVNEYGSIESYEVLHSGSGYVSGDILTVMQSESGNNATLLIEEVNVSLEDPIPQYSSFHYHDPKASAPGSSGTFSSLVINYVEGVDNSLCSAPCASNSNTICSFTGVPEMSIGNIVSSISDSSSLVIPTPIPSSVNNCEFQQFISPETEYKNSNKLSRPKDNEREKYTSNYISRRVAYQDLGPENGKLIVSLLNYRTFFIASTSDTDLVIRIKNADRDTYVVSANPFLSGCNFYTPIRLNLGTASGTVQYVEATGGTLVGSSGFWNKTYEPPLEQLEKLELSFYTYDGTPIPIERSLGFLDQIKGYSSLFTAAISSSFIVHGSYDEFKPNLPPFSGILSNSPSSVVVAAVPTSKSLKNPFNPYLETYTQRNFGIIFKITCYHPENPGTTEIIRKIPGIEQFEETDIPLASNMEEYA